MRFLITGGAGFLGSWLSRTLVEEGHEVMALDTNQSTLLRAARGVKFQRCDISAPETVTKILREFRPNTFVHYAAILSAAAEDNSSLGYKTNIASTWPLFDAARSADVESIIFASSMAAYGPGVGALAKETTYAIPSTIYGISKVFGEMAGTWFERRHGIRFAALRYASVIGPGRRNGGASAYTSLAIQKSAQGQAYDIAVRRTSKTPVVYIKDAVKATLMVAESKKRLGHSVFNVCGLSPTPTAIEIARATKRQIPEARIRFQPVEEISKIIDSWPKEISTERLSSVGWRPSYADLDIIIDDFVGEIRANPKAYWV